MFSSRKNPYPPHRRSLEMYENKLEFLWGGGGALQNKKPSMGGVWILSGTVQCSADTTSQISLT